jgi:hypothetical protein
MLIFRLDNLNEFSLGQSSLIAKLVNIRRRLLNLTGSNYRLND